MARTPQEFLQSLLKSITNYYTATYSSDTNLYQILKTYGVQFASGSLELDTTRNNAFVVECIPARLFNNFGTFFDQGKYYLQSNTDDKYVSGSAVYTYIIPTTAFEHIQSVSSSYFDPWALRSQQSPTQNNGNPGYLLSGTVGGNIVQAFNKMYFKATYHPADYDMFTIPYILSFDPTRDKYIPVDPHLPGNTDIVYPFFPQPQYGYLYTYGPWGSQVFNAYQGHGKFGPTQLCMWMVMNIANYPTVKLKRSFDGITFEDVLPAVFTFVTNGNLISPDSAKFTASRRSVVFHDKLYTIVSGVPADNPTPYQAYPVCLSYDGTKLEEAGLYTYVRTGPPFTYDQIAQSLFVHNNKLYCIFNRVSGNTTAPATAYSFDTIEWSTPAFSFAFYETVNDAISFDGDIYATIFNSNTGTSFISKNFAVVHQTFTLPVYSFVIHEDRLYVGGSDGQVYRLSVDKTTWNPIVKIPQPDANQHVFMLGSYNTSTQSSLYAVSDSRLWSSDTDIINYKTSTISGSAFKYHVKEQIALPSYRKQLSFMMEAAVKGSTPGGVTSMVNGFTLINPDIREFVSLPAWKLKSTSGSISQVTSNVWQFHGLSKFIANEWTGSHALLVSGSLPTDKVTAGYLVLTNTSNTVTIAPIYEQYLRI